MSIHVYRYLPEQCELYMVHPSGTRRGMPATQICSCTKIIITSDLRFN